MLNSLNNTKINDTIWCNLIFKNFQIDNGLMSNYLCIPKKSKRSRNKKIKQTDKFGIFLNWLYISYSDGLKPNKVTLETYNVITFQYYTTLWLKTHKNYSLFKRKKRRKVTSYTNISDKLIHLVSYKPKSTKQQHKNKYNVGYTLNFLCQKLN